MLGRRKPNIINSQQTSINDNNDNIKIDLHSCSFYMNNGKMELSKDSNESRDQILKRTKHSSEVISIKGSK